jgi:hypothetical protein
MLKQWIFNNVLFMKTQFALFFFFIVLTITAGKPFKHTTAYEITYLFYKEDIVLPEFKIKMKFRKSFSKNNGIIKITSNKKFIYRISIGYSLSNSSDSITFFWYDNYRGHNLYDYVYFHLFTRMFNRSYNIIIEGEKTIFQGSEMIFHIEPFKNDSKMKP